MQQATMQEMLVEASQLLQELKPETTATIDDLLLQASLQFEGLLVVFGMCDLVIFSS